MNKDFLRLPGIVKEVLPAGNFRVELGEIKKTITVTAKRRLRGKRLLIEGSKVIVKISPYDFNRGEIISFSS